MGVFDRVQTPKVFSPLVLVREGYPQRDGVKRGLPFSQTVRLLDDIDRDVSKSFGPEPGVSSSFGHHPFSYAVYKNYFSGHLCCCHQGIYGVPQHFQPLNPHFNFLFTKDRVRKECLGQSLPIDKLPGLKSEAFLTADQESLERLRLSSTEVVPQQENLEFCGKSASSPITIKQHELLESERVKQRRFRRPKTYKCPYCDVCCSNQGQLRGHVRIHTGERPYRCSEKGCAKAFIRNEELTRHKRIHTGERPHKCVVCGKAFSRKDHLNKHARVHTYDNGHNNI